MMGQEFPNTITRTAAVTAPGLMVMAIILFMGKVSGAHLNPIISISAYVARRLSLSETAGYVLAQVAGGVVAAFLLRAIMPKSAFDFASGGVPGLATGVSVLQATAVEVVLSFFLTFTFWAVFVDDAVRIGVGCQSAPGGELAVRYACEEAIRSAHALI